MGRLKERMEGRNTDKMHLGMSYGWLESLTDSCFLCLLPSLPPFFLHLLRRIPKSPASASCATTSRASSNLSPPVVPNFVSVPCRAR